MQPPYPKNSLYARYYTPVERRALASLPYDDLSSEIKLFRVLLMRLLAAEKSAGDAILLEDHIASLRAVGLAVSTLGALIRLHLTANNPGHELDRVIFQALEELNREQGYTKRFEKPR